MEKLVRFGFYSTRHELVDLIDPLVKTLDGRSDRAARHGDGSELGHASRRLKPDPARELVVRAKVQFRSVACERVGVMCTASCFVFRSSGARDRAEMSTSPT